MIAGLFSVALAGSLAMKDLTPCTGGEIRAGSVATVHYEGWVKGEQTPFDSSRKRGEPAELPIGRGILIEGWEIGMQGMSPGCTRRLEVPPELGYGRAGIPGTIPQNATLVFEIELLAVSDPLPPRIPPEAPREVPMYLTTDSGLQYFDLEEGTGPMPRRGDKARVEYTLWLPDGTRVDSSFKRPAPFEYKVGVGKVIDGWEEAVLTMKVGGTRQFVVPWKLAYGRRGRPPVIPRKSDLVFEVTLLELR